MTEPEIQETAKALPRVIRSNATGRYFLESDTGAWVDSPGLASTYDQLTKIVEVCQKHGLADVDLVINSAKESTAAGAHSVPA
jgi:GTPase Era involved in 16S rRNA processing